MYHSVNKERDHPKITATNSDLDETKEILLGGSLMCRRTFLSAGWSVKITQCTKVVCIF